MEKQIKYLFRIEMRYGDSSDHLRLGLQNREFWTICIMEAKYEQVHIAY